MKKQIALKEINRFTQLLHTFILFPKITPSLTCMIFKHVISSTSTVEMRIAVRC